MAVQIEELEAPIVVTFDEQKSKRAETQVKVFARDTKKELDNALLTQLRIDQAKAQIEKDRILALLRQAKKEGDQALILKLTIDQKKASNELTEAGRRLNNYVNTGDVQLSRLQAKFN